eukprot:GFUD01089924.1.p1 GENE.GFUD01089924.1~~GFUD01089924.1.p1  ORF type:complete len:190 (+),score=52.13 GFUD01089924.1:28-570(+)
MSHQTQTNFNTQLTSQQNTSDINQALPHYKLGPDQKSHDADMSRDAVDMMGVALVFCLMSIVAVVGLHKIKVLTREVENLSRKVVWLEGSQAVAECEDRESSTPPPGYSVLDENRGTSGQVSLETPSYPQTSDTSYLIAQLLSSRTGLSTTPPLCMTAMGYQQLLDTEEICPHHLRHHHQ